MDTPVNESLLPPSGTRREMGRALREKTPPQAHADYQPSTSGRDAVAILEESNQGRMQDLVPIRYGRMLVDPFAFYADRLLWLAL